MRFKAHPQAGTVSLLQVDRVALHEVLTAAALNCYDGAAKARAEKDKEGQAYHDGLLKFIQGMEDLLKAVVRPVPEEVPLADIPMKERRKRIEETKSERLFLDSLIVDFKKKHAKRKTKIK